MTNLLKACDAAYVTYESNCSGFLKEVCRQLGVVIDQGNADAIADYLAANWTGLDNHAAAKQAVDTGKLVVVALESTDSNKEPKPSNGHVAIVLPVELYRQTYPKVYCGGMSTYGRSQGDKSVGEIWAKVDRDSVNYYQSPTTPPGLYQEAR